MTVNNSTVFTFSWLSDIHTFSVSSKMMRHTNCVAMIKVHLRKKKLKTGKQSLYRCTLCDGLTIKRNEKNNLASR